MTENRDNYAEVDTENADDAVLNESDQKKYNVSSSECREGLNNEDKGMVENITNVTEGNLDMEINEFKKVDRNLLRR